MENQITEERDRRATVLTADGDREDAIIRSQGERAKIVLNAEATKVQRVAIYVSIPIVNVLTGYVI